MRLPSPSRRLTALPLLALLAALAAGCGTPPELQGTVSEEARQAPRPRIAPLLPIRETFDTSEDRLSDADRAELEARAAALEARTSGMR